MGVPGRGGGSVVVRVRVGGVAAAVALVDGVGGARPHVEHDDEDENHDAERRHDDPDHLCKADRSNVTEPYSTMEDYVK